MPATVRSARPKDRTYRFTRATTPGEPNTVSISEFKGRKCEVKHYWLSEFTCDGGRAFRWETFSCDGGNVYEVFISSNTAEEPHACCCRGHLKWGHQTVCRHIAVTCSLIERGRI
jgi:hypothetical protein